MKRVLVVDDSAFVAKLLGRVIESLDCSIVGMAHDGLEGVAAFGEHKPDVTLLDVTMPNMDGLECLQEIRKTDPNAKVIMISAVRTPDTVDRCLAEGAVAFIQKPIRPNSPEDIDRLRTVLDSVHPVASDTASV